MAVPDQSRQVRRLANARRSGEQCRFGRFRKTGKGTGAADGIRVQEADAVIRVVRLRLVPEGSEGIGGIIDTKTCE
jgi:hypothetical protein